MGGCDVSGRDFEVWRRSGHRKERLFDAETLEELGVTAFEMDGLDVEDLLEDDRDG